MSRAAKKKPLSIQMMPRDVSTWWNSSFDMLEFALLYQELLDDLTGIRKMKLRPCKLSEQEWTIAEQLASVLKVCHCPVSPCSMV